jgi:hypothetical protein
MGRERSAIFVDWKNTIERAYEDMEDNTYNWQTRVDSSQFLLTSCQICKQYSYVPKYFRAHVGRAKWEANACALVSKQLLSRDLNPGLNRFLLRTDHWTKRKPSKSETEQGYDMGLRGMSTQGFQLEFALGLKNITKVICHFTNQCSLLHVYIRRRRRADNDHYTM